MVSVQQVFDMAIHLMDEQNESTGATVTVDTQEYKFRTISILNSINQPSLDICIFLKSREIKNNIFRPINIIF